MTLQGPIVVTGAGGFVGRALVARLGGSHQALRLAPADWRERIDATRFPGAIVFHLAARVHVGGADDATFMLDNRDKTVALAEAASRAGARRFVFVSSSKAMGEETRGQPLTADDAPRPVDAYGRSKLAAEQGLAEVARASGLEYAIVRAPLVLGAGAKGNLASLLRACDSAWPLPFGALANRRSFVHVDDLARLLVLCAESAAANARTYLAAHRDPFSTSELIACVRESLRRPARLFDVAPAWLERVGAILGQSEAVRRLTRSLELDPGAAERDLGWRAQRNLRACVEEMVRAYREERAP